VLGSAVAALVAPRVDVNSATVASALQSKLPGALVQCKPSSGEWTCTAYPPSSPTSCPATSVSATRVLRTGAYGLAVTTGADLVCASNFRAAMVGAEVDAAIRQRSPHEDRMQELRAQMPKDSDWDRIVGFFGRIFGFSR